MGATASRIVAAVALGLAGLLLAISLFSPWWGFGRETEGVRRWERYGPFHRDEAASGSDYRQQTGVLGALVVLALVGILAGFVAQIAAAARGGRGRAPLWLGLIAGLLVAGAVLYAVFAFPAEANRERGTHLSFIDRECTAFRTSFCFLARPDAGWYVAIVSGVMALGSVVTQRFGAGEEETETAAPGAAAKVAVVRPRGEPATPMVPAATNAPTRVSKCPQCQTRVSFRKPGGASVMAECHNCGLRFPA